VFKRDVGSKLGLNLDKRDTLLVYLLTLVLELRTGARSR